MQKSQFIKNSIVEVFIWCPYARNTFKIAGFIQTINTKKRRNPYRIAFFSSGGMDFASNWTALRLPCRVFALQKSRSPLARPLRKKNATPIGLRFFQVAGWASRRIGLRCACPVGFLRCKNPVRLSPARSAKKTQPLSDCVFF